MNEVTFPAAEATKESTLTLEEAIALCNKKIDYWRNFRAALNRIKENHAAEAVVVDDPEITPEQKVILEQASTIRSSRTPDAKEVLELLKPGTKPEPDDVKKPQTEPTNEEAEPEIIAEPQVAGGAVRG